MVRDGVGLTRAYADRGQAPASHYRDIVSADGYRAHVGRPGNTAGASAKQEYESLRKDWIRRNWRAFAAADTVTVAVVVASLASWWRWPNQSWVAGLAAGVAITFNTCVRLSPPHWIDRWMYGAAGEQRTARQLEQLPGDEWLVLHDIERGNKTNVDHVVVGPPGVLLFNTKTIGTEVRIDADSLIAYWPDGRIRYTESRVARAVKAEAVEMNRALARAGVARCWVSAVVVVWGDMAQGHVRGDNIDWVPGNLLVDWLRQLPARTNVQAREAAQAALHSGAVQL